MVSASRWPSSPWDHRRGAPWPNVRWWSPNAQRSLVGPHGEGVDDGDRAAVGGEGGLQDHRLVHVAAGGLEVADRADRPVTGVVVQQAAEDGGTVEPREAQPFDRALPAHQGGRVAV